MTNSKSNDSLGAIDPTLFYCKLWDQASSCPTTDSRRNIKLHIKSGWHLRESSTMKWRWSEVDFLPCFYTVYLSPWISLLFSLFSVSHVGQEAPLCFPVLGSAMLDVKGKSDSPPPAVHPGSPNKQVPKSHSCLKKLRKRMGRLMSSIDSSY